MPRGRAGLRREVAAPRKRVADRLPTQILDALREHWAPLAELDAEVDTIERRIAVWHRQIAASRRIAAIPGIGVLCATAAVATMGDPAAFGCAREFAASPKPAPPRSGTGVRVRMLGISKRGDRYLQTLLIHGARDAIVHGRAPSAWRHGLASRTPPTLSPSPSPSPNKTAGTTWALLAHDRQYEPRLVNRGLEHVRRRQHESRMQVAQRPVPELVAGRLKRATNRWSIGRRRGQSMIQCGLQCRRLHAGASHW